MRILLLMMIWGLASAAMAAPAKVAILPVESTDEAAALRIHAALRAAVGAAPELADHGLVAMTVEEAKLSFSCFEAEDACMAQVGEMLSVDRLLWGRLFEAGGKWRLELRLIDVKGKTGLRAVELDPKSSQDFPYLEKAAEAFVRNRTLEPSRVALKITSRPSDAEVRVDGVPMGRTPLTVQVEPGPRAVSVRKSGFAEAEQLVRVGAKGDTFDVTLARESAVGGAGPRVAAARPSAGRSNTFWTGVGLAGVATAAAITGGVFRVKDHQLAEDAKAQSGSRYAKSRDDWESAKRAGNIAFIVAGAAAVGSVTLFVLDAKQDRQTAVTVTPAGVGLVGTF